VPYTLLGVLAVWLLTRNVNRALSVLMVDFSCALKLSMPLAVLSAMRECGGYRITVKGGAFRRGRRRRHQRRGGHCPGDRGRDHCAGGPV